MERELFDNNKIIEALCQFTFKPAQDNTIYGQYYDLLKAAGVYTEKENVVAMNFTVAGGEQGITPTLVNAMKYTNSGKDKIIQLHSNNISIHQVKKYQKWELFKTDIDSAFLNFTKVSTGTIIERIDLRAINSFEFTLDNFDLSKYFNVHTSYPKQISNPTTNITLEFPLAKQNSFVVLRLKCSPKEKQLSVVLDLSFVRLEANIKSDDTSGIDEVLQYGHAEMYKLFTSVITDETKKLIK